MYIYIYTRNTYMYIYIYTYIIERKRENNDKNKYTTLLCNMWPPCTSRPQMHLAGYLLQRVVDTHGSFLIRRQRGHPGVVLPLVVSNPANR